MAVAERGRKEAGEKRRVPSRLAPRLPDARTDRGSVYTTPLTGWELATIAGDRARHTVHPLGQDRKLRPKPYQGQREGQNRRVTNVPTPADRQRGGSQSTPPLDLLSS